MLKNSKLKMIWHGPALRRRGMRLALLGGVSLLPIVSNFILPRRAHAATCSGVITGLCSEITIGANGNVTVTATGAAAGGTAGISNSGYGIGTLSNSGSITGSSDAGIINDDSGSIGTLISNGLISGKFVGVYNDLGGSIGTLNNEFGGTIAADIYYGVFNGAGTIDVLSNDGLITAVTDGVDNNAGFIGTLSNAGIISGTGKYGIIDYTGATISLLDNETGGTIFGANDGVHNIGVLDTLINIGTIDGIADAGVSNRGSITLLDNGIDGWITGGTIGVENYSGGTIQTMSNVGVIDGTLAGILNDAAWIGTLANGGTITGGAGIVNELNGTITELSNTGSISNIENSAVVGGTVSTALYNAGTINALTNDGTISGLTNGVANFGDIGTLSNAGSLVATNPYETHDIGKRDNGVFNAFGGTIGALLNNLGGVINATSSGVVNAGSIGLLSNNGTINGTFSEGVDNQSSGVIGTLLNDQARTIFGGATGVVNAGTINVLINDGSIIGGDASGIQNYGGLIGSLTNSGLISGEFFGLVDNGGSIGALDNTGTITASNSAIQETSGGDIRTLTNSGTITAVDYGVYISSGTIGALDNQANGVITAGESGIQSQGYIGTLRNSGLIEGADSNGVVNFTGTIALLDNRGTILASNIGVDNAGSTTAVQYSTIIMLSNSGTISGADAFWQNAFGAVGTIANIGTLAVLSGGTQGVFNDGMIGTLSNAGTIMTTTQEHQGFESAAVVAILNSDDGSIGALDNLATGTIIGASSGIYNLGSIGLLSNSGLISGGSSGINSEGGIATLSNAGIITGGSSGVDNEGGSIGALTNTGTISGADAGVLNTYNRGNSEVFGTIALLDNGGLITGGSSGVANESGSTIFALSNTGTISGGVFGVYNSGGIGTLDNAGLIEGGHVGVQAATGSIGAFDNAGTIIGGEAGVEFVGGTLVNSGTIAGPIGVILTGDDASIVDSGTIASSDGGDAILFRAPDPDSLTLTTGADIIGTIDGGGTAGQITLQGDGTLDDTVAGFTAGSALNVGAGASWAGAGTWTIASLTNDGVFQGGLIGAPLTLTGNFVQTPNGTLLVAVTPSGNTQFLVDGSVTLAGGLKYEFAPGTYHAGTYAFITATDGIAGSFASAAYDGRVPSAFTHATLQQLSTGNLVLTAIPGGGPGAPVAGVVAPADSAVFGDTNEAAAVGAQAANADLLNKASEGAGAAADAAACAAQAADMNATGNGPNVSGAARMATAAGQAFCTAGGWVEATGGVAGITGGAAGYNANNAGFLAGIDTPVNQAGTRLGLAVGYGETWLKDGAAGKASLGTARAGMFASQPVGDAVIAADVMYGVLNETTTRQTGIGALQARPDGGVVQGGAQAEIWLPMASFALAPAAGLRFAIVNTSGFAEYAGRTLTAFALRGASGQYTSVQPYLNVTASRSYLTESGVTVTPDAMLGYVAELGDRGKSVAVTAPDGTAFASGAASPGTSAAELSAGLAAGQGNWSLYAKYSADLAGNWTEQTGEAGLQVRF